MKSLSVKNIANFEGFSRAESLDFTDDGSRFTGWMYKNLPITQHVSRNHGVFLKFRVDYIYDHNDKMLENFTWLDWMELPEHTLTDKFNGVDELPSLEEIAKVGDEILAAVGALNEKKRSEPINTNLIMNRLGEEVVLLEVKRAKFLDTDLFDERLSDFDVNYIRKCMRRLESDLARTKTLLFDLKNGKIPRKELVKLQSDVVHYGHVVASDDYYYAKEIAERLEKAFGVAA